MPAALRKSLSLSPSQYLTVSTIVLYFILCAFETPENDIMFVVKLAQIVPAFAGDRHD